MLSRALRFIRSPSAEKRLIGRAMVWLIYAVAIIRVVPMREWRKKLTISLGANTSASQRLVTPEELDRADYIGLIVRRAARNLPLPAVCLPQAMAAQWMLRRENIPSLIHIGARRKDTQETDFHAWLTVGDRTVTGADEQETFQAFGNSGSDQQS